MAGKVSNEQVTVIVRHKLRPGTEVFFEGWLAGIEKACQSFEGFMGTDTIKPVEDKGLEYACIFRFDNFLNLDKWIVSSDRAEWIALVVLLQTRRPFRGKCIVLS